MSILIRVTNGEKLSLQSSSKINNLDQFINENQVLRVGGRIKRSNLNTEYIHPILLSGKSVVTNLFVKWYHQSVCHSGRGYTFKKIRSSGYWIVNTNTVIQSFTVRCVRGRYLRGNVGEKKMADLPGETISTKSPTCQVVTRILRQYGTRKRTHSFNH